MTARLPITELTVRRAIRAARKEGVRVIHIRPDGSVVLVDGGPELVPELASNGNAPVSSKWEDVEA